MDVSLEAAVALALACVVGCTETKRQGDATEVAPSSTAAQATSPAGDAGSPPADERSPCDRNAPSDGRASLPGLLVIDALDDESPTHGKIGAGRALFRLGNLTDRQLDIKASSLTLRRLDVDADAAKSQFAIASVTADGVNYPGSATIKLPPRACIRLTLTTDEDPDIDYHQRYAFVSTFSVDGHSVDARSGDRYFRYPHRWKP